MGRHLAFGNKVQNISKVLQEYQICMYMFILLKVVSPINKKCFGSFKFIIELVISNKMRIR